MTEYYCEICDYKCYYNCHLEQHMNSNKHKNGGIRKQRPDKQLDTKCPHCPFEIKNSSNMLTHILTKHSTPEERKEKFKHYCEKCDFGTFTEILFNRHEETQKHNSKIGVLNV